MILKKGTGVVSTVCILGFAGFFAAKSSTENDSRPLVPDPALTRLFTPPHPLLGRYEVLVTSEPLPSLIAHHDADPTAPNYSSIDALEPLDAFGGAGLYSRSALVRLYGGRRASVARGWTRTGDRFESRTLISPYPNASLSRLNEGTMVIVWTLPEAWPTPR
jgi:hypothetical protein